jgi:immediate early protein
VSHLIFCEITWGVAGLKMTDAAMTKCVHTARRNAKPFANRLQHLPHDIVIFKRCPVFRLKNAACSTITKVLGGDWRLATVPFASPRSWRVTDEFDTPVLKNSQQNLQKFGQFPPGVPNTPRNTNAQRIEVDFYQA